MTFPSCRALAALALLAAITIAPGNVRAENYHSCVGFIDSVPATISTQGVWCLRKDLSTGITSGNAITIAANNVTIDCNGFKLGGLAAGDESTANGIYTHARQNATVRHCNVRGFYHGIYLLSGAGHLVEDNRLDNSLYAGIRVGGDNNLVQRNRVYKTGGAPGVSGAVGIFASADVIDNSVVQMFADGPTPDLFGILASRGSLVRNNRVRALQPSNGGAAYGIWANGFGATVTDNQLSVSDHTGGSGISAGGITEAVCSRNIILGFDNPITDCRDGGGNTSR